MRKNIERSLMDEIEKEIRESIIIGEIMEGKLEVKIQSKEILEKFLSNRYELTYIGDTKAPYDYIAKDSKTGEVIFIKLKTIGKLKFIIYTENEKEFAERITNRYNYWLYVVDLIDKQIRGYLNPFPTKLKLVPIFNNRKYFVYEEIGKADEIKNIDNPIKLLFN